jgi:hypothetical protein
MRHDKAKTLPREQPTCLKDSVPKQRHKLQGQARE